MGPQRHLPTRSVKRPGTKGQEQKVWNKAQGMALVAWIVIRRQKKAGRRGGGFSREQSSTALDT